MSQIHSEIEWVPPYPMLQLATKIHGNRFSRLRAMLFKIKPHRKHNLPGEGNQGFEDMNSGLSGY